MSVLQRMAVEVRSEGEHVIFVVGSNRWTLHYTSAILLAFWMRQRAKEAKAFSGDDSRAFRCLGVLHDANRGPDADQPFTPGRVYPVARDVLAREKIKVAAEGSLVKVTMGATDLRLPYAAALTIAQWIRLRGKESKRRAGDVIRHWSDIPAAHLEQHGPITRG